MSEKMSELYQEYDVEVIQSIRGRGAIILKTDKGIRQLKPLTESEGRLASEYQFKEMLSDAGFCNIDRCIPNREGELVTYDRYGNPYVMRMFFEGRECLITGMDDIRNAIRNLANFHLCAAKVYNDMKEKLHIRNDCDFAKRNRELKRIRNFIGGRTGKKSFELLYMEAYDYFYNQALECEKRYSGRTDEDKKRYGYCHGTYDYHSVINTSKFIATINFDRFYAGNQLADLYHFLRKALEKNRYSFQILKLILEEYGRYIKLCESDYEYIYILLSFPEKFYKISNQYMNSSKTWISPKMQEKLEKVIDDEEKKKNTLFEFKSYYSLHI